MIYSCHWLQPWLGLGIFLILQMATTRLRAVKAISLNTLYPFDLVTSTMKAQWTTSAIVLDPSYSWQTPTTTGPVDSTWDLKLLESNLTRSASLTKRRLLYVSSFFQCFHVLLTRFQDQYDTGFGFHVQKQKVRNSLFLWPSLPQPVFTTPSKYSSNFQTASASRSVDATKYIYSVIWNFKAHKWDS
jgi:hypothetical protein